ncbi:hypothetical protein DNTS_034065 [Danionella cerebrum]|uniref:Uncharacterized protein n=1 Tax=Danionella cerebrum TaxID=2873325 RepID=A0A553Q5U9_9TELE|nr:hypothetical protein DNTS_034065 [Danionella translucida]
MDVQVKDAHYRSQVFSDFELHIAKLHSDYQNIVHHDYAGTETPAKDKLNSIQRINDKMLKQLRPNYSEKEREREREREGEKKKEKNER